MARHEVVIHENTSATHDVAPYTGSYIAKETLRMSAFATAIGNKCGLPAIQVMAILSGAFEAIEALERDGLVRVWTDLGVVCAVITGSLPTADAAFDPERNSLELVLRLGDDIRYALTDTVPTIITDEDLTKLRVDNVMDLEEERPMNLIHGKHVFRVAGFNMVLTDEGAAAYLENSMGTTFPLTVDEVVSKQLFKAHTTELLEAGDYKLVVKSRAGDAAGPLQTSFRRVKYLRVVDPEPVPVAQSLDGKVKIFSVTEDGQGESFTPGRDWLISGSGLVGNGWEVLSARLLYTRRLDGEFGTVTVAPDGRSAAFNIARDNLPDADENLFSLEINLVREGSGSTEGDEHLIIDGITLSGWPYYDG